MNSIPHNFQNEFRASDIKQLSELTIKEHSKTLSSVSFQSLKDPSVIKVFLSVPLLNNHQIIENYVLKAYARKQTSHVMDWMDLPWLMLWAVHFNPYGLEKLSKDVLGKFDANSQIQLTMLANYAWFSFIVGTIDWADGVIIEGNDLQMDLNNCTIAGLCTSMGVTCKIWRNDMRILWSGVVSPLSSVCGNDSLKASASNPNTLIQSYNGQNNIASIISNFQSKTPEKVTAKKMTDALQFYGENHEEMWTLIHKQSDWVAVATSCFKHIFGALKANPYPLSTIDTQFLFQ